MQKNIHTYRYIYIRVQAPYKNQISAAIQFKKIQEALLIA